jgi:hypothetical protein
VRTSTLPMARWPTPGGSCSASSSACRSSRANDGMKKRMPPAASCWRSRLMPWRRSACASALTSCARTWAASRSSSTREPYTLVAATSGRRRTRTSTASAAGTRRASSSRANAGAICDASAR